MGAVGHTHDLVLLLRVFGGGGFVFFSRNIPSRKKKSDLDFQVWLGGS